MAAAHGFRVFVVEAYKNRKKGREPESVYAGSETAKEIAELLQMVADDGTVFFEPPPVDNDSDEPAKRAVSVTVRNPVVVREDLIHFVLSHGERGERPHATHPTQPAQTLSDYSTEVEHFVALLFPNAEGDRFLVVSQTIHRRDPISLLLRLLRVKSQALKKAAMADQEATRQAAKDAGQKPQPRRAFHALLFERAQASDNAYLDEILDRAKSASAEFEARVPSRSARAGQGDVVQRKLSIKLLGEDDREVSSVVARRWTSRRRRGEATPLAAGVSELAAQLEEHDLMDHGEADMYNRASIAVRGESGAPTRIAVDTLKDVFTYPVSDGPPSVYQHYKKVAPRVEIIAAEEGIEVQSIDPLEIDECLPD